MPVDIPLELDDWSCSPPPRSPGNGPWIHEEIAHNSLPPWWNAYVRPGLTQDNLTFPSLTGLNDWVRIDNGSRPNWTPAKTWFPLDRSPELVHDILVWRNWAETEAQMADTIRMIETEWRKCEWYINCGKYQFSHFPTLIVQNSTLGAFAIQYSHIWKNIILHWWWIVEMSEYLKTLEEIKPRQKDPKDQNSPLEYSRQWLDPLYFTLLQLIKNAHKKPSI